jgi:hypothetical protein
MAQAFRDLGIDFSSSRIQNLEQEVDTYFAISSGEKYDSIAFWEICYVVNLVDTHLYDL